MEFDLENPLSLFQDLQSHSLPSLFLLESDQFPSQITDFDLSVRRETLSLILNFSHPFDPFLSYLAINYLDRFLSTQSIHQEGKPWILRLIAVSCVSLALKMRKTEYSISDFQCDGGFIFDKLSIKRMEFLILGALKWRMRSVTPFSFINFFISLFKFKDPPFLMALKARATDIIFKAQQDIKLFEFKPSIISASALLSACDELFPLQFLCFKKAISNCSYVNKDNLCSCYDLMQDVAMEGYESVLDMVSSSSTPVNVLDRQCLSSDTEKTGSIEEAIETATIKLDKDTKRRKISNFRSDNSIQLSQIL